MQRFVCMFYKRLSGFVQIIYTYTYSDVPSQWCQTLTFTVLSVGSQRLVISDPPLLHCLYVSSFLFHITSVTCLLVCACILSFCQHFDKKEREAARRLLIATLEKNKVDYLILITFIPAGSSRMDLFRHFVVQEFYSKSNLAFVECNSLQESSLCKERQPHWC